MRQNPCRLTRRPQGTNALTRQSHENMHVPLRVQRSISIRLLESFEGSTGLHRRQRRLRLCAVPPKSWICLRVFQRSLLEILLYQSLQQIEQMRKIERNVKGERRRPRVDGKTRAGCAQSVNVGANRTMWDSLIDYLLQSKSCRQHYKFAATRRELIYGLVSNVLELSLQQFGYLFVYHDINALNGSDCEFDLDAA